MVQSKSITFLIIFLNINLALNAVIAEQNSIEQCGSVIEGNNGTIEFDQIVDSPIQCVWTIQAISSRRLTQMKFFYEGGNINTASDMLSLSVIKMNYNMHAAHLTPYHILVDPTRENQTYTPSAYTPVGFSIIVFRTNSAPGTRKHFRLSFQAEDPIYDASYPHYNMITNEASGSIRYPPNGTALYPHDNLATFVISNQNNTKVENILLQFDDVEVQYCGGEAFYIDKKCNCDGITVYEILPEIRHCDFCREEWEKTYILEILDKEICGYGGGYGFYSNQGFVIAHVSDRFDNDKLERPGVGFSFNWKNINRMTNPEMSAAYIEPIPGAYTSCGGVLENTSGYIEYKLNKKYDRNEFCVWTVRAELFNRISFSKEESGLVVGEDLITVTMIRAHHSAYAKQQITTSTQLNAKYAGKEEFNLHGTVAIIVFTSNDVNEGTGFRLKYTAYADGFKYTREYTDVGNYEQTGQFGQGYAYAYLLSTFVVAPALNATSSEVDLHLINLDIAANGQCNLNVLFLYEILPSSTNHSENGHIKEVAQLCQRMNDLHFYAERGFFGVLVTTKTWDPINGYSFEYSTGI